MSYPRRFWLLLLLPLLALAVHAEPTPDASLKLVQDQPFLAHWPVFFGPTFPKVDFLNPDLVAAGAGPYTLNVRYFDAAYNEVKLPSAAGRYGALAKIHFANGATATRRVTLYHTPGKYVPALDPYRVVVTLPASLGLPSDIGTKEPWNISDFAGKGLDDTYNPHRNDAVLIAALHDQAADPARWHGFFHWQVDVGWWRGLAEKLGTSEDYQRVIAVPEGYDQKPDAKWPLIIFLHGSGNRGDDLARVNNEGPLAYAKEGHLPFIIAVPLCPDDATWDPVLLSRMLDQLEAKYRVDPKRIYVTGVSMGGYGTFFFAGSYPNRIAAIAPLAGGANPTIAERLKHTPTWIFHGGEDSAVPARYSLDVAAEMKRIGAPVVLSYYKDWGHGGWVGSRWGKVPYQEPDLYAWFLKQALP